jgi:hypothetical protein
MLSRYPRGKRKWEKIPNHCHLSEEPRKEACPKSNNIWNLLRIVRFEVFTAVTMKNAVFWDVAPCRYFVNRRFGGTYCLHFQCIRNSRAMNQREQVAVDWVPPKRRLTKYLHGTTSQKTEFLLRIVLQLNLFRVREKHGLQDIQHKKTSRRFLTCIDRAPHWALLGCDFCTFVKRCQCFGEICLSYPQRRNVNFRGVL